MIFVDWVMSWANSHVYNRPAVRALEVTFLREFIIHKDRLFASLVVKITANIYLLHIHTSRWDVDCAERDAVYKTVRSLFRPDLYGLNLAACYLSVV